MDPSTPATPNQPNPAGSMPGAAPQPVPAAGVGSGKPKGKAEGKAAPHPNSTQNSLQIAEIRDGIVIMNDGSFRSVVMVKSINFDLMSPRSRKRWSTATRGF